MRFLLPVFCAALLLAACTGLGKKGSATVPNPVGPVNSSGKPDVDKTNGGLDLGSDPNLGGTPDVTNINAGGTPDAKKTNTKTGPAAANSGGRPDASKSIPKKK